MVTAILIAATLPFAVSIIIAFGPSVKATSVGGYFLYNRKLDADGFVKVTIGYSLQVASISLFFYWAFTYGVVGPLFVCLAWGVGYFAIAYALKAGKLSGFLSSAHKGKNGDSTPTIHGYIGQSVDADKKSGWRNWAVASVALASIIGLGGTMMAEIDYSVGYLTQALGIPHLSVSSNLVMASVILIFTVLYVLWGGYRSAVATDRIQVPFAYVAFSTFILGVAVTRATAAPLVGIGYELLAYGAIIAILMWRRLRLVRRVSQEDVQSRLSAFFTFFPILLFDLAAVMYVAQRPSSWDWAGLMPILKPQGVPVFGFPFWGLVALLVVNSVWQLIDISSLQRLQSLDEGALSPDRNVPAVGILRAMGVEAALGWVIIIIGAIILRSSGLLADSFLRELSLAANTFWLVPLFVFTVLVYMLSTISGFISALSYISFYDIVPIITGGAVREVKEGEMIDDVDEVRHPRITTIVVIALMLLFYTVLRLGVPGEQIASVLYAIYAFQIVILPSAIGAIFFRRKMRPAAVIFSVFAGIMMAYVTAASPLGETFRGWLGADAVSWQVMPPLITAVIATLVFALVSAFGLVAFRVRPSPPPAS